MNRKGSTWKNPFEKKYRAIDCKGNLVNAEDVSYGIYFCIKCLKILFWRYRDSKEEFYHNVHNPSCPLSVKGGHWGDTGNNTRDTDYKERWIEAINDLYKNGLLHLLKGQDVAKYFVELYLDTIEDKSSPVVKELTDLLSESVWHTDPVKPDRITETGLVPVKDYNYYLNKVKMNGLNLKLVPNELRNKEICLEAAKRNIRALQFVPDRLLDKEMYIAAIKNKPSDIKYYWDILSFKKIYEVALEIDSDLAHFYHDVEHHITWRYEQE
jgi:hypothetical protein